MEENLTPPVENNQASSLITESTPQGSSKALMIVPGVVFILTVGTIGYILSTRMSAKKTTILVKAMPTAIVKSIPVTPTITSIPTPIISPVTKANVAQTLTNTDASMQQLMNQVDTDLNTVNSIDATQDSTTGL